MAFELGLGGWVRYDLVAMRGMEILNGGNSSTKLLGGEEHCWGMETLGKGRGSSTYCDPGRNPGFMKTCSER